MALSISSRCVSRTLLGTKIDYFVTTANDSQPLTVVPKNFILDAKLQVNIYLVRFSSTDMALSISSRCVSRTLLGTKIDYFVTTANDSQPLTVVPKNFILDATDALDLSLSILQYDIR